MNVGRRFGSSLIRDAEAARVLSDGFQCPARGLFLPLLAAFLGLLNQLDEPLAPLLAGRPATRFARRDEIFADELQLWLDSAVP